MVPIRVIAAITLAVSVFPGAHALGQPAPRCEYIISTVAGIFDPSDGVEARRSEMAFPVMAVDWSGNVFTADRYLGRVRIRMVTTDGLIHTLPGHSFLQEASALAVDNTGAVYVVDRLANQVTMLQGDGSWQVVAGNATAGLERPRALAIDLAGNLYIGDNGRISQLSPDGSKRTIARSEGSLYISSPSSIAVDGKGNVYFVDSGLSTVASAVWIIGANGVVRKIIDLRHPRSQPGGIAVDANGNLLIADTGENRIIKLAPSGEMESLAKGVFLVPSIIGLDGEGGLHVFDLGDNRISKLAPDGSVEAIAGGGRSFAGDGGPSASATLSDPDAVALDNAGNLYIVANDRVRKVTPDGLIQTIAGNGAHGSPADPAAGYAGDGGPAIDAGLEGAQSIAVDPAGSVYIAHYGRIRKMQPDGLIRTFAGPFQFNPNAIAADSAGNLYAAAGSSILKITSNGVVETLMYVPGASPGSLALAFYGPGTLWVAEQRTQTIYQLTSDRGLVPFAHPVPVSPFGPAPSLAGDTSGNLYLSDAWNSAIYRISADGLHKRSLATVTPALAVMAAPHALPGWPTRWGIAVDTNGSIFVADSGNHRVRKLTPYCQ